MRWSYQHRMESGTFLPSKQPYGYAIENGAITIVKSQAKVINWIFTSYLSGKNVFEIADELTKEQDSRPELQNYDWNFKAIARILKNEKYVGDSLWQKKYSTDTLPVKQHLNHGEKAQYYAKNTHPAIISADTYRLTQERLCQHNHYSESSAVYVDNVIQRKMRCGECGAYFRHKNVRGKLYCVCKTHDYGANKCSIAPISEQEFNKAFLRLYYKLKHHGEDILAEMLRNLHTIRERRMLWRMDIIELNKQISNLTSQNQTLAMLKQQGLVDPDIFISQSNELAEQLRAVKLQKERVLSAGSDDTVPRTQELLEILDAGPERLDVFDAELFGELIDKIIVDSSERIRFILKNGLELAERIERTVR